MSPSGLAVVGLRSPETAADVAVSIEGSPVEVASDVCALAELYLSHRFGSHVQDSLMLGSGWSQRWTASWRVDGGEVVCSVQDLASAPVSRCRPVRRFAWRAGQRHRPGLQYLVSTGRHHGFESIAEQRLLLALDFVGVRDVVAQPFRLRFRTNGEWREHVPDFLAILGDGRWLFDVRPAGRVGAKDEVCFAAAGEAALAAGWGYAVVTGWRAHVVTTLDTLSAQRRPLRDPLGCQPRLVELAVARPRSFVELAAATTCPAVARAHLVHLLWHRRLGVDCARPLGDQSLVWHGGR